MSLRDKIVFIVSILGGVNFVYGVLQIPEIQNADIGLQEIAFFIFAFIIGTFLLRRLLCILLSYRTYEYIAILLIMSASFMYSSSTYAPFSFGIVLGNGLSIVLIGIISKEKSREDSRCDETLNPNSPLNIKYLLGLFIAILLGFYIIQSMAYKDDTITSIQKVKRITHITKTDETNKTIAKQYGLLEHNLNQYGVEICEE